MTDTSIETAVEKARERGAEDGKNAGEWWAQENVGGRTQGDVTERAAKTLLGIEDGDPSVLFSLPVWNVQEYPLTQLEADCDAVGMDITDTFLIDAYDNAFTDAVVNECERQCRLVLA